MKKKIAIIVIVLFVVIVFMLCWAGVGSYSSSSAVRDLKTELEAIYGTEYADKDVGNGTEEMVFEIEPETWFLTNWNLRNAFGIDYKYECKVIFTTRVDGNITHVRTITYQAFDPMGADKTSERAYLDLASKAEATETISVGKAYLSN